MQWIIDRAKERSTWAAVISAVTSAMGWTLAPEMAAEITTAALGIVGLVALIVKEEKK